MSISAIVRCFENKIQHKMKKKLHLHDIFFLNVKIFVCSLFKLLILFKHPYYHERLFAALKLHRNKRMLTVTPQPFDY